METNTTASTTMMYTYQPQPQVLTPMPVQTQVISVRQSTYATEKSVGLGVAEIILRIICLVSLPQWHSYVHASVATQQAYIKFRVK